LLLFISFSKATTIVKKKKEKEKEEEKRKRKNLKGGSFFLPSS
jgi:hypothetical protein